MYHNIFAVSENYDVGIFGRPFSSSSWILWNNHFSPIPGDSPYRFNIGDPHCSYRKEHGVYGCLFAICHSNHSKHFIYVTSFNHHHQSCNIVVCSFYIWGYISSERLRSGSKFTHLLCLSFLCCLVNYHKLSSSKQYSCISSQFCRSEYECWVPGFSAQALTDGYECVVWG